MEEMESSFPYLRVYLGGNLIGRKKHLFLSIPLKPQICIPLKIERN